MPAGTWISFLGVLLLTSRGSRLRADAPPEQTKPWLPDIRPCNVNDQHISTCNDWEYRLVTTGYDKQALAITAHVATGRQCKGCIPRPARVGMLCLPCWSRLEQALSDWPRFERMIRGVDRAVRGDGGGRSGSAAGYVPLPTTVLSVEECRSYLCAQAWNDARSWVSNADGARNAVQFTRAAQIAYRPHPIEEKARKPRRARCPDCGELSFVRNPPADADMPVIVRCENAACGKTIREGDTTPVYGRNPEDETEHPREKLVVIAEIERNACEGMGDNR